MHCLWGLQQNGLRFEMKGGTSLSKGWGVVDRFSADIDIRFDPPRGLNLESDAEKHVKARRAFYDGLAGKISIPGIVVERAVKFDDEKAQNGGISLKYESHFGPLSGLKTEVLLGMGRVTAFIGTPDYATYKAEKLKGSDADAFVSRKPFTLDEGGTFDLFEREFASMNTLLLSKGPSFKEVAERLRDYAPKL